MLDRDGKCRYENTGEGDPPIDDQLQDYIESGNDLDDMSFHKLIERWANAQLDVLLPLMDEYEKESQP